MSADEEQEAVRALLKERFAYGIGREISSELNVANTSVYRFHKGRAPFPAEKLGALRAFLLRERVDPQARVRALFVDCLSRRKVRASDVARRFGVSRSTVSRFKEGTLSFPAAKLEELAAHLRTLMPPAEADVAAVAPGRPGDAARPLDVGSVNHGRNSLDQFSHDHLTEVVLRAVWTSLAEALAPPRE